MKPHLKPGRLSASSSAMPALEAGVDPSRRRFLLAGALVGAAAFATTGIRRHALQAPWRYLILGSLLAADGGGGLSPRYALGLAQFVSANLVAGRELVIVSSGAVAAGRRALGIDAWPSLVGDSVHLDIAIEAVAP